VIGALQEKSRIATEPASMRVLVVEDQPAVAKALRMLFDLHEISCQTTSSAATAAELVASGAVDLVIQDMNLTRGATSGEEGIALFRRLRSLDAELPVILITAWTSLETAVQLVKEGAADYLEKPWDDAKLLSSVRNLLDLRGLRMENARLRSETSRTRQMLARDYDLRGLVYESEAMHRIVTLAVQIARSEAPVLITGPNGAGKEKIAEIVHANSGRRALPFLKVNAGALPDELLESELFGAEAGAYTGSKRLRLGRFEAADGGTLFLDEIGNLSPAGQMKLLRVLQSGEFERLGSSETRRVDVRLLCATNADLRENIGRGRFRQDLFFRLNVIEIAVPPLRERREDVLPLAEMFLGRAARGSGRVPQPALTEESRAALLAYDWPGNVRELENRITRATLISDDAVLTPADLGFGDSSGGVTALPAERRDIELALLNAQGSVSRAADALGLSRQALYRKMEKLGITLERRPR
jgi:DNA-binding NtrC family response regulator